MEREHAGRKKDSRPFGACEFFNFRGDEPSKDILFKDRIYEHPEQNGSSKLRWGGESDRLKQF